MVSSGLWVAGTGVWDVLASFASAATFLLFANMDGIRSTPGEFSEAISLAIAVMAAAIAPSFAMSLFRRNWTERYGTFATAFPSWIGVMIAPTVVIFAFASNHPAGLIRAQHSFEFVAVFSALATSIALLTGLWLRLNADAVAASEVEIRRSA